jgi:hypothetical protein
MMLPSYSTLGGGTGGVDHRAHDETHPQSASRGAPVRERTLRTAVAGHESSDRIDRPYS